MEKALSLTTDLSKRVIEFQKNYKKEKDALIQSIVDEFNSRLPMDLKHILTLKTKDAKNTLGKEIALALFANYKSKLFKQSGASFIPPRCVFLAGNYPAESLQRDLTKISDLLNLELKVDMDFDRTLKGGMTLVNVKNNWAETEQ